MSSSKDSYLHNHTHTPTLNGIDAQTKVSEATCHTCPEMLLTSHVLSTHSSTTVPFKIKNMCPTDGDRTRGHRQSTSTSGASHSNGRRDGHRGGHLSRHGHGQGHRHRPSLPASLSRPGASHSRPQPRSPLANDGEIEGFSTWRGRKIRTDIGSWPCDTIELEVSSHFATGLSTEEVETGSSGK
jgi:hypothetical protein